MGRCRGSGDRFKNGKRGKVKENLEFFIFTLPQERQFWSGKMSPNVGMKRMSFLMLNKPGFETNCVTLGKLHNLSVLLFLHL